jgi:hypothetical protein
MCNEGIDKRVDLPSPGTVVQASSGHGRTTGDGARGTGRRGAGHGGALSGRRRHSLAPHMGGNVRASAGAVGGLLARAKVEAVHVELVSHVG